MGLLVFRKALRGHRAPLILCVLVLLGFQLLIASTYQEFGAGPLRDLLEHTPKGLSALLKAEGQLLASGPNGYVGIGYRHPIYLVVVIGFAIAIASGSVAKEIERKSILLLLSRPLSRSRLLVSRWAELATVLVFLVGATYLGTYFGALAGGIQGDLSMGRFALAAGNALALFLALGNLAFLISASVSDGTRAMAGAIMLAVGMFLLDFIAQLWSPLEWVGPVSLFHYYNPVEIAAQGGVPLRDLTVLLGVAVVSLAATFVVFQRRDLR